VSWVFDATPLIYLAKADRLDAVETLDEPRVVPEAVYREVVTAGVEQGYDDARRIERAVEDGCLDVVEVDLDGSPVATRLDRHPGLSDADVAVLACADARDGVAVMDEAAGRSAAAVEDVETRGTAYLVLAGVKDGELSKAEGRDTIDAMIDHGWYVAPDVYAKIVEKLESVGG
jgi:predicted nucleic acid-binding protein